MDEFIAAIKLFAGNFAPRGWAFCDGRSLPIDQYQAVYALIGTTYGGNGTTTFNLPDLRGRAAVGFGTGPGLTGRAIGQMGGTEAVTLLPNQLPAHAHPLLATNVFGDQGNPANAALASTVDTLNFGPDIPIYKAAATPNTPMAAGSVGMAGGSQSHDNMSPFLGLNYIICLEGIFPSRD
jgi:microcystin-dependent protein